MRGTGHVSLNIPCRQTGPSLRFSTSLSFLRCASPPQSFQTPLSTQSRRKMLGLIPGIYYILKNLVLPLKSFHYKTLFFSFSFPSFFYDIIRDSVYCNFYKLLLILEVGESSLRTDHSWAWVEVRSDSGVPVLRRLKPFMLRRTKSPHQGYSSSIPGDRSRPWVVPGLLPVRTGP